MRPYVRWAFCKRPEVLHEALDRLGRAFLTGRAGTCAAHDVWRPDADRCYGASERCSGSYAGTHAGQGALDGGSTQCRHEQGGVLRRPR